MHGVWRVTKHSSIAEKNYFRAGTDARLFPHESTIYESMYHSIIAIASFVSLFRVARLLRQVDYR